MFERFTDSARRVLVLAQEEARLLNHNFIGSEHILLGLIREGAGLAAQALESLGIYLEAVRERVAETVGAVGTPTTSPPFTPRAKKVLELSLREAMQLGYNDIGTEHMLLGLIREGEGVGAQVLVNVGADLTRVRQQVIQLLSGRAGSTETLPTVAGVAVAPADIPVEPSAVVTWADVEAVLSKGQFVERSTTERRKANDLEYRHCVYRPRHMPAISVAVAGARMTPEAFDALEPGEGTVERVEGLGDAATFDRAAGSLRVLKGEVLLVISASGHADPLAVTASLAEKALDRLSRDGAGPS